MMNVSISGWKEANIVNEVLGGGYCPSSRPLLIKDHFWVLRLKLPLSSKAVLLNGRSEGLHILSYLNYLLSKEAFQFGAR